MDYDLFVRFMAQGKLARVDRVLGVFRYHADSESHLLATLGEEEKRRVHEKYGICHSWSDRQQIELVTKMLRFRSWWHVKTRRRLAGSLPGIGYDYDDVWGGQLNKSAAANVPSLPSLAWLLDRESR